MEKWVQIYIKITIDVSFLLNMVKIGPAVQNLKQLSAIQDGGCHIGVSLILPIQQNDQKVLI